MDSIRSRLKDIRRRAGLSLRAFSDHLGENASYDVSHFSVSRYENGRTIPADYLLAVSEAFDVNLGWLLTGQETQRAADEHVAWQILSDIQDVLRRGRLRDGGSSGRSESSGAVSTEVARARWKEFAGRLAEADVLPFGISLSAPDLVEGDGGRDAVHRLNGEELADRLTENHPLIAVADPHLRWISSLLSTCSHVVYLTDRDGVVIRSFSHPDGLAGRVALEPGHDWNLEDMGTTGSGLALETGRISTVFGSEHYPSCRQRFACLSVPIRSDSTIVGALGICTPMVETEVEMLLVAAYVVRVIESVLDADYGA